LSAPADPAMNRAERILSFWFGALGADGFPLEDRHKLWFRASATTDRKIRERFEPELQAAAGGRLRHWQRSPRTRLALIIVLDQFSRNIYRGTPRAFAQDAAALAQTLAGIDAQHDLALGPIERTFFYMPLEHAEDLAQQQRCIERYTQLMRSLPAASARKLESAMGHVIAHRDIVARFGRFPHRNKILGRPSTAAEIEFLSRNPSTFGQG
jgi:uncharacterized protein (DUF924 family)